MFEAKIYEGLKVVVATPDGLVPDEPDEPLEPEVPDVPEVPLVPFPEVPLVQQAMGLHNASINEMRKARILEIRAI